MAFGHRCLLQRISQTNFFNSLFLLLCLRPMQAHASLSIASDEILTLLQLRRTLDASPSLRESCHRAYWAAYLLELEMRSYSVTRNDSLLAQQAFVTLPVSDHDEPGMFWFLSEIALRRLFQNVDDGLGFTIYTTYAPLVASELTSQLKQWHDTLPEKIKFSIGNEPVMNPQTSFLRAQYHSAACIINWPSVVRYLTLPTQDQELEQILLESARRSINSAISYVYAAEALLQERHVLLFAKHTGLVYQLYLLLLHMGRTD